MTQYNPASSAASATHASLHSAPLVRFLAERELLQLQATQGNVGERLGQWLDFRQAITLHKLLGQDEAPAPWAAPARAVADAHAVRAHVNRTREALHGAILHARAMSGAPLNLLSTKPRMRC